MTSSLGESEATQPDGSTRLASSLPDPSAPALTLAGLRVVEVADEKAEYCGLLLAGLGAEVVKVEPMEGSPTRRIGPFFEDEPGPERSLFFWQYNRGKKSVRLDLETDEGKQAFDALVSRADLLVESTPRGFLDDLGLGREGIEARFPALVHARMTPFGDDGPWADYKASDLIHLALGGPMMNCGYDPRPDDTYDLPPIAPQMWHAYQVAGEQLMMGILAALVYRQRTGLGQRVDCAIHEAVAKCTEGDWPNWVMRRAPFMRQTCRHAMEQVTETPMIGNTKDGRWLITRGPVRNDQWPKLGPFLATQGMANDLNESLPEDPAAAQGGRSIPGSRPGPTNNDTRAARATEAMHRLVKRYTFWEVPWRAAQDEGFLWAPLYKPHENLADPHWHQRGTFAEVHHEDLGRSFTYAVSKWLSTEAGWDPGRRAPRLGEDDALLDQITSEPTRALTVTDRPRADEVSNRGEPWALQNTRILDFTWFLASGGATRFLAALGAETIKVEWKGNPDTRFGAQAPVGGREARDKATAPLPPVMDRDMGGQFNNKHPGKYGISLNVKDPRGLEIAKALAATSDIVAEGFSPGVMDKLGLGYDTLRALRPDIILCQQSAMGTVGTYKSLRSLGPLAQALAGLSEMSGLPEPALPAGWGYSYLDWMGAYSFASAMLGALYHRDRTGRGQRIDASQVEIGIFLNGTALVDWSANGRPFARFGNRSPYKLAAPHGAFPCRGTDRWLAIACFDEPEWKALVDTIGAPEWTARPEFATLESRIAHQDELDLLLSETTSLHDRFELMHALQGAGVPAGVCQTAEDRVDHDPQLAALEWLVEVPGTKIGTWPVGEMPVDLSRTPSYIGGRPGRGAPIYGEDNRLVYEEILGLSSKEVDKLEAEGVI